MKSYVVKISDREEGPYDQAQMAQMFADARVDRDTPCKPSGEGDWKTIDDYLPMLKYGTQLPPTTKVPAVPFEHDFQNRPERNVEIDHRHALR